MFQRMNRVHLRRGVSLPNRFRVPPFSIYLRFALCPSLSAYSGLREHIRVGRSERETEKEMGGGGRERERGEKRMHRQPDGGPGASREPGKRKLRTDSGRCYRFESSHVSLSLSSLVTSSCLASCRTWVIVSFHRFISFTSLSIN